MKLAIENASPLRGSYIFWSNFSLALRSGAVFAGFGIAALSIELPEDATITVFDGERDLFLLYFIAAIILVIMGSRGFGRAYMRNTAARRLRYQGLVTYRREPALPDLGQEQPERDWRAVISPRGFHNPMLIKTWYDRANELLKDAASSDAFAQFAVGITDKEELKLSKVHSCDDSGQCPAPQVHVFGYKEERDGRIWWP